MQKRQPAVAGQFYTSDPRRLRQQIEGMIPKDVERRPALGAMCPHAGYVYSGATAGQTLGRIPVPDNVLILNPNHRSAKPPFGLWSGDAWTTPLGDCPVDEDLRGRLMGASEWIVDDTFAHLYEHSGEVIVPFLQVCNPNVRINVMIVSRAPGKLLREVGEVIGKAISERGEPTLIVASSDMSHYISAEQAKRLDMMAIEKVKAMDPDGLLEVVEGNRISMCGVLPVSVMLTACARLGATSSELVCYDNSGTASGDYNRVVGYAGVIVS
ncbi:MAG TPA: AmmeMemoRadiSam system protein B [Candidatus Brocadiia bacterium]|nr:AmmeMemoRadiSam system protein B [Candidatus Brocadiia bacterium]